MGLHKPVHIYSNMCVDVCVYAYVYMYMCVCVCICAWIHGFM